jgi:hypothetical protein
MCKLSRNSALCYQLFVKNLNTELHENLTVSLLILYYTVTDRHVLHLRCPFSYFIKNALKVKIVTLCFEQV